MTYVTVEVSMTEFEDQDLIDELEERGYHIDDGDKLTDEELDDILERYSWYLPGTLGYNIYEKLKKK